MWEREWWFLLAPCTMYLTPSHRPPAPEPGATMINTGTSPVLAQTFTEPFTVYSAKRFPGVPDTTALSIALGNQGQKLPLVCHLFTSVTLILTITTGSGIEMGLAARTRRGGGEEAQMLFRRTKTILTERNSFILSFHYIYTLYRLPSFFL